MATWIVEEDDPLLVKYKKLNRVPNTVVVPEERSLPLRIRQDLAKKRKVDTSYNSKMSVYKKKQKTKIGKKIQKLGVKATAENKRVAGRNQHVIDSMNANGLLDQQAYDNLSKWNYQMSNVNPIAYFGDTTREERTQDFKSLFTRENLYKGIEVGSKIAGQYQLAQEEQQYIAARGKRQRIGGSDHLLLEGPGPSPLSTDYDLTDYYEALNTQLPRDIEDID